MFDSESHDINTCTAVIVIPVSSGQGEMLCGMLREAS